MQGVWAHPVSISDRMSLLSVLRLQESWSEHRNCQSDGASNGPCSGTRILKLRTGDADLVDEASKIVEALRALQGGCCGYQVAPRQELSRAHPEQPQPVLCSLLLVRVVVLRVCGLWVLGPEVGERPELADPMERNACAWAKLIEATGVVHAVNACAHGPKTLVIT